MRDVERLDTELVYPGLEVHWTRYAFRSFRHFFISCLPLKPTLPITKTGCHLDRDHLTIMKEISGEDGNKLFSGVECQEIDPEEKEVQGMVSERASERRRAGNGRNIVEGIG